MTKAARWLTAVLFLLFALFACSATAAYTDVLDCAWAKTASTGTADIGPVMITAKFANGLYAEHPDRRMGVRVNFGATQATIGDLVYLRNAVPSKAGDEVYVTPSAIDIVTPQWNGLTPVAMPIASIGGSAFGNQPGVDGAVGLNNTGLLVSTCGKITVTSQYTFTLDDGSGVPLYGQIDSGTPLSSDWTDVKVTGISTVKRDAANKIQRYIRVRGDSDIKVLTGTPATILGRVFGVGGQYQTFPWVRETNHPVSMYCPFNETVVGPANSLQIRIHFTKMSFDGTARLYLTNWNDQQIRTYRTSNYPDGVWSPWAPYNVMKVEMGIDPYATAWGFSADVYECELNNPQPGVTMTLEPGGQTTATGSDGSYSFAGLAAGTYTVTPSCAGMTFDQESVQVSPTWGQTVPDVNFTRQ